MYPFGVDCSKGDEGGGEACVCIFFDMEGAGAVAVAGEGANEDLGETGDPGGEPGETSGAVKVIATGGALLLYIFF